MRENWRQFSHLVLIAIGAIGGLTFLSGVVVAAVMNETLLAAFLLWRLVRPMNLFVVDEHFEARRRRIGYENTEPIFYPIFH